MSRHRIVHRLSYGDSDDGDEGGYDETEYGTSPSTAAQYMYRRTSDARQQGLDHFLPTIEDELELLENEDRAEITHSISVLRRIVPADLTDQYILEALRYAEYDTAYAADCIYRDLEQYQDEDAEEGVFDDDGVYDDAHGHGAHDRDGGSLSVARVPNTGRRIAAHSGAQPAGATKRNRDTTPQETHSGPAPVLVVAPAAAVVENTAGRASVRTADAERLASDMEAKASLDSLVYPRVVNKGKKSWEPEEESESERSSLNLVVVGHVDAGKSTLMGHLLVQLGEVHERVVRKFEKESREGGKASFHFAWVLDENEEERQRGVTVSVAMRHVSVLGRHVTILDAPGHKDFVPEMISGAAQADVAILVVSAGTGEFEAGFDRDGQTREHAVLVRSLGVRQLLVVVNKLDLAQWSRFRFDEIRQKLLPFLKKIGFKERDIRFVPCSGLAGQNVVAKDGIDEGLRAWYQGPTVAEAIRDFQDADRVLDFPVRVGMFDMYKSGSSVMVGGRIEAGTLRRGYKIIAMPSAAVATVKGITLRGAPVQVCGAGAQVELQLGDLDDPSVLTPGTVLCDPEKPVRVVMRFRVQLLTFDLRVPLVSGSDITLYTYTASEPATVSKLRALLDPATGEVVQRKPRCVGKYSTAIVDVTISRPVCLELYRQVRSLGRVALRDRGTTIAAGTVVGVPRSPFDE